MTSPTHPPDKPIGAYPFMIFVEALGFIFVLWLFPFIGDTRYRLMLYVAIGTVLMGIYLAIIRYSPPPQRFKIPFLLAFAAFSLLAGYLTLAYYSCWCCMHPVDLGALCDSVKVVTAELAAAGIPHWVCWGSLLGAVREHAQPFQIIPWEHDFDLCVLEEDMPRMEEVLKTKLDSSLHYYNAATKQVQMTSVRSYLSRTYTDIYPYKVDPENPDNLMTTSGGHTSSCPRNSIEPLKPIRVCNTNLPANAHPEVMLKILYGDSYMQRYPPSNILQRLACSIHKDCNIPPL